MQRPCPSPHWGLVPTTSYVPGLSETTKVPSLFAVATVLIPPDRNET
jgi:hypothetical protein